jgi:hypothetical protein
MTNPVTKWELQEFSLELDIGKLMENFFNLRSFGTNGVVHTHHIQFVTCETPAVNANTTGAVTGLTYDEAFPSSVSPVVIGGIAETGGGVTGGPALVVGARNITNTGFDATFFNAWSSTTTAGGIAWFVAFDPTYNVTDY